MAEAEKVEQKSDPEKSSEQPTERKLNQRTMMVPFDLTEDEIHVRHRELVAALKERDEVADTLETEIEKAKGAKKTLEAKLEEFDKRAREIAGVCRSGREDRLVDVEDVVDGANNRVDTVRADTGEIVKTRGMTDTERDLYRKQQEAERQRGLFHDVKPTPLPEASA